MEIDLPGYSEEQMSLDLKGSSSNRVLEIAACGRAVKITVSPRHIDYAGDLGLAESSVPATSVIAIDKPVSPKPDAACLKGAVVLTFQAKKEHAAADGGKTERKGGSRLRSVRQR